MIAIVSSTNDQRTLADSVKGALRERNIEVRFPTTTDAYPEKLEIDFSAADAIIFIVGEERSNSIVTEWSAALEFSWERPECKLIPILVEGASLPGFLRDRIAIQVVPNVTTGEEIAVQLLAALNSGQAPRDLTAEREERLEELGKQSDALEPQAEDLGDLAGDLEKVHAKLMDSGDIDSIRVALELSSVLRRLGEDSRAIDVLSKTLREVGGRGDRLSLARLHNGLASLLQKESPDKAIPHLQFVIDIYASEYGQNTLRVFMARHRLADAYDANGNAKAAEAQRAAAKQVVVASSTSLLGRLPFVGGIFRRRFAAHEKTDSGEAGSGRSETGGDDS